MNGSVYRTTLPDADAQTAIGDQVGLRKGQRIAFFLPSLAGGGVARVVLLLTKNLIERGYQVDLVLCRAEGAFADQVPHGVNIVELQPESSWCSRARVVAADPGAFRSLLLPVVLPLNGSLVVRYILGLVRYLQSERPTALFAAKPHTNLVALWARRLAGVNTRIIISERTHLSRDLRCSKRRNWRWRFVVPLIRRTYPWADGIIAISNGLARDLCETAEIPRKRITVIHNPVPARELIEMAEAPLNHAWFRPDAPPVILGVGRLVPQKDFSTLLQAFSRVRAQRICRLMILGEEKNLRYRDKLLELARGLDITDDLAMPGFVSNPFAYMRRARVFVLSSAWEGFANALAEALACGCPVVSTDCPSGPAEVLSQGEYGRLVPVGNHIVMAEAINSTLDHPPKRQKLFNRAAEFPVDRAVSRHLNVLLGSK